MSDRNDFLSDLLPPLAFLGLIAALAQMGRHEPQAKADGKSDFAPPPRATDSRDLARSLERNRGRDAENPAEIPARGWKDILWRTYNEIGQDRLLAVAAGSVFYMLLALFPAIAAFVSLYGLFASADTIATHLSLIAAFIPAGAFGIIEQEIARLTGNSDEGLSLAFVFGLGLALWSANAGMKALMDSLNVAYGEVEKRSFVRLNLVSFAFTLGAIVFLLLAVAGVVVLPIALKWAGLEAATAWAIALFRWPALLLVLLFAIALLYRFGPSRREAKWQWLSVGSVFAALAWLSGSALLSWYLENFADYNATYGSLGAAIGLMMWLWLSAIVLLVGAELNAEIEHQTARDSTSAARSRLAPAARRVADAVGASR